MGGKLTAELAAHPAPLKFMVLSRKFAEHLGLISNSLRPILDETDKAGSTFSMAMLGESLFALIKPDQVREIREILDKRSISMVVTEIDRKGARLL
jgi:pantoate kinase